MSCRISLLATGGTISTRRPATGSTPRLGARELADLVDGQRIDVRCRDVSKQSSRAVTPDDMWGLANAVNEEIDLGADGIVITHGTDTLEETAYALALLVKATVPVVLTGSMRSPDASGSDAPANLAAALNAAARPELSVYGPVVVMHDEIHLARWVTKQHSSRVGAFGSPATGPIGTLVEGTVQLMLGPPPDSDELDRTASPSRRVELIWTVAGADGLVVDAVADKIDGLVVAGTGGGHVPPPLAESLIRLVQSGRPVILASRCGASATVLERTYGGAGSEMHLLEGGLVSAGSLSPVKARLRLLFGLSADLSAQELFPAVKVSS